MIIINKLFVGFKGINNSSYCLVNSYSGDKLFLTNSMKGLVNDINNANLDYESVYMFGVDKNLKNSVRIEMAAEKDEVKEYTILDIKKIEQRLISNGINATISEIPTHYLCNEAYYHMLVKVKGKAVFVHLPSYKYITDHFIECLLRSIS